MRNKRGLSKSSETSITRSEVRRKKEEATREWVIAHMPEIGKNEMDIFDLRRKKISFWEPENLVTFNGNSK